MRKVIVYAFKNGSMVENGKGPASFHQFGYEYEEFVNGAVNISVAIVEYEDGTIETVMPNCIKFIQETS